MKYYLRFFAITVCLPFLVSCGAGVLGEFSIDSATADSGSVTLAWGSSLNSVSYDLSYGTSSGVYSTAVIKSATSPTTVTGLTNGTPYYFMVSAKNGSASKDARAEISATPHGPAPGAFAITRAVSGKRNVILTWENSSDATSYTVKYGLTSGTYDMTASTSATSPFNVTSLSGVYYFMVQAVNAYTTTNATSEKVGAHLAVGIESEHTCYVSPSGVLKCWGYNNNGQLGKGNTTDLGDGAGEMGSNLTAIDLGTGRTVRQVASGAFFSCAILDNKSVKCWGQNAYGQLGKGNTTNLGDSSNQMGDNLTAVDLGTGRTAVQLSLSTHSACAILDNGSVKCWGYNGNGELGQGDSNNRGDDANEMGDNLAVTNLGTGRTAVQLSSGAYHHCALLDNATVKCWGRNQKGQLGQGSTSTLGDGAGEMGDNLTAIDLGTGRTAKQVAGGSYHSCALLDDSTVKCWGWNNKGQLGKGNTTDLGDGAGEMGDSLTTIDLGTGRTAKQISAGLENSCAILDNDTLKCWGRNDLGQLGKGNTTILGDGGGEMGDNLAAIDLGTGRTPLHLTTGINHCVILDDYTVKCWGYNSHGQLGKGNTSHLGDGAGEMGDNLTAIDLGL